VQALFKNHPGWEGKTVGQLSGDPDFRSELADAIADTDRRLSQYFRQPRSRISVGSPPADMPAEGAFRWLKEQEAYLQRRNSVGYGGYRRY
jgi:hypothetical protein